MIEVIIFHDEYMTVSNLGLLMCHKSFDTGGRTRVVSKKFGHGKYWTAEFSGSFTAGGQYGCRVYKGNPL